MDKPVSFYAFEMPLLVRYPRGRAVGFDSGKVSTLIRKQSQSDKSYQRLKGQDVITSPKTKRNRTIETPEVSVCRGNEEEYLGMLYGLKKKDRIFTVTKSYLHHGDGQRGKGGRREAYPHSRSPVTATFHS